MHMGYLKSGKTPIIIAILCLIYCTAVPGISSAQDSLRITTWNIEHLGSEGRGFGGGFGGGSLPPRSDLQLAEIGLFLKETVDTQIIAVQEISITHEINSESKSSELDKITASMGESWKYYLPPKQPDHGDESMYVGFIWNESIVNPVMIAPLDIQNIELAGKALFDRIPVVGYFETIAEDAPGNDFLIVNVHLASGQDNDENHLIAMVLIEYQLKYSLSTLHIRESDRIILGDFNDNPYAEYPSGTKKYSDALYRHMERKGYRDFVTPDFHSTRMDSNLTSIIDHMLINKSAQVHVMQTMNAEIWLPPEGPEDYPEWRETFSDHFPISIDIKISGDDDSDWENN